MIDSDSEEVRNQVIWKDLQRTPAAAPIVLVVEDQASQREGIIERIRFLVPDAFVIPASTSTEARQALATLQRSGREIAIAVLDLILPKDASVPTGKEEADFELPWQTAKGSPRTAIIWVSAYSGDLHAVQRHLEQSGQSLKELEDARRYFLSKADPWPSTLDDIIRRIMLNRDFENRLESLDPRSATGLGPGHMRPLRSRMPADDTLPLREALLAADARKHWVDLYRPVRERLGNRLNLDPVTGASAEEPFDTTAPTTESDE